MIRKLLPLFLSFILFLRFSSEGIAQTIIPTPETITQETGRLHIPSKSIVRITTDSHQIFELLEFVFPSIRFKNTREDEKPTILFTNSQTIPSEGYEISITQERIHVQASDRSGFLYALISLRQWSSTEHDTISIPQGQIKDRPLASWRGFLLDSGRQYQSPETIKKYIDMMVSLKMNRFHWHLTEGLGWRLEIKRYPDLTRIGSRVGDGKEQQGFYSQKELKEIIRYAAKRGITIIPEIDMPGHAEAALKAYPLLSCFGEKIEVPKSGFTHQIFCAGKDSTLRFLENVLDEVCELFPSTAIHLGGDEAPKENWDKCSDCQERIRRNGLRDAHDLQLWFAAHMADYLKTKGRKAIFWGDLVYREGYPLPNNIIIQWWNYRGRKDLALKQAKNAGLKVLCSTNTYTYLNFPLTPWRGYGSDRTFDLRDAYERNPSAEVLRTEDTSAIGMECALWTDDSVLENMIDTRLFPRIFALAEQMWHIGCPLPHHILSTHSPPPTSFRKCGLQLRPLLSRRCSQLLLGIISSTICPCLLNTAQHKGTQSPPYPTKLVKNSFSFAE